MEAFVAFALGTVVFMQGLQMMGLSTARTTGIVGAVGALVLLALIAFQPVPMIITGTTATTMAGSFLAWLVYTALVAAVGLWDFDARGLGFFSAWGAVVMLVQVVYSIAVKYSLAGILCGAIQLAAFVMLFLYLALPSKSLKKATTWVLVVAGPLHGILGFLLLAGIPGLSA